MNHPALAIQAFRMYLLSALTKSVAESISHQTLCSSLQDAQLEVCPRFKGGVAYCHYTRYP